MTPNEINALNRIIKEAIDHGGDPGGPYFVNHEKLTEAMEDFKDAASLDGYVIVIDDGYYRYEEREKNERA